MFVRLLLFSFVHFNFQFLFKREEKLENKPLIPLLREIGEEERLNLTPCISASVLYLNLVEKVKGMPVLLDLISKHDNYEEKEPWKMFHPGLRQNYLKFSGHGKRSNRGFRGPPVRDLERPK